MFDSRTDAPHKGVHADRHNYKRENLFVGYSVSNPTYRLVHQAPAMTIEEGLREYQDDLEERNCQNDGLRIAKSAKRAPRPPYTTESPRFEVIAARIDADVSAKPRGFVSVRTRRNAYAR